MLEDNINLPFQLSRMNFFLVHLSLADILTTLLTLVPEIAWTLTLPAFWGGPMVCKFIKFVQVRRKKKYVGGRLHFEDFKNMTWSSKLKFKICV